MLSCTAFLQDLIIEIAIGARCGTLQKRTTMLSYTAFLQDLIIEIAIGARCGTLQKSEMLPCPMPHAQFPIPKYHSSLSSPHLAGFSAARLGRDRPTP
ncbi:MAG: hypothetical protein F6J93_10090 [Oscillatoria sp. SIO1A7]|nr:hypothetical protein [Oscillatoria sp. SIO1A7]